MSQNVITFSPDRVGLKFAGESAKFNTTDGFHKYVIDINNGRITVFADGKELVSGKLVMKADDPAGNMTGNNLAIPNMHSRSLVIGSLSEKGTGAARQVPFQKNNSPDGSRDLRL